MRRGGKKLSSALPGMASCRPACSKHGSRCTQRPWSFLPWRLPCTCSKKMWKMVENPGKPQEIDLQMVCILLQRYLGWLRWRAYLWNRLNPCSNHQPVLLCLAASPIPFINSSQSLGRSGMLQPGFYQPSPLLWSWAQSSPCSLVKAPKEKGQCHIVQLGLPVSTIYIYRLIYDSFGISWDLFARLKPCSTS